MTGGILAPIAYLFLMVFSKHTQMPELYGIQTNKLGYYTIFALYIIPWNSIVDVCVENTLASSQSLVPVLALATDSDITSLTFFFATSSLFPFYETFQEFWLVVEPTTLLLIVAS